MKLPIELEWFGIPVNLHLVFEYLAFFIGYRYYVYLRKNATDHISSNTRLSVIIGAVFGALIGSRIFGYLENPIYLNTTALWITALNSKTIMGGLFGGLLGVEISKKIIGETQSTGDLFTLPIILGIFIGRIGCFLSGIKDFTYGVPTTFFAGMDLGDGILRHPLALYELVFLVLLFLLISKLKQTKLQEGSLFKIFMISYFLFRFFIEFLKPNTFLILQLSSIQYLCILCILYYTKDIKQFMSYAYKRLHLL